MVTRLFGLRISNVAFDEGVLGAWKEEFLFLGKRSHESLVWIAFWSEHLAIVSLKHCTVIIDIAKGSSRETLPEFKKVFWSCICTRSIFSLMVWGLVVFVQSI